LILSSHSMTIWGFGEAAISDVRNFARLDTYLMITTLASLLVFDAEQRLRPALSRLLRRDACNWAVSIARKESCWRRRSGCPSATVLSLRFIHVTLLGPQVAALAYVHTLGSRKPDKRRVERRDFAAAAQAAFCRLRRLRQLRRLRRLRAPATLVGQRFVAVALGGRGDSQAAWRGRDHGQAAWRKRDLSGPSAVVSARRQSCMRRS
jgi:hypothetical protein